MNTLELSGFGTVKDEKEYDIVKTNLLLGLGEKKVISVLSTSWGQEVPALSVQFARSLARGQRKVLLINTDMDNQSCFEPETAETGLFPLLTGDADFAECVCATDIDGLYVLPSGTVPEYASELLSGVRFRKLLGELRTQYDYVFILSPAMDKSLEGITVSSLADGCVVITFTNTAFSKIKTSAEMLQKNSKLIGTILVKNTAFRSRKHSVRSKAEKD